MTESPCFETQSKFSEILHVKIQSESAKKKNEQMRADLACISKESSIVYKKIWFSAFYIYAYDITLV